MKLETIVHAVCAEFGRNEEQVLTKGRKKNKAREVAIHLARDSSGMSCKDLAIYFGGVNGALITITSNRVTKETAKNKQLKGKIGKGKKLIFNI